MDGLTLFERYTALNNSYSQTLLTLFAQMGEELFPFLEKAEKQNKKISIKETYSGPHDNYSSDNIILV